MENVKGNNGRIYPRGYLKRIADEELKKYAKDLNKQEVEHPKEPTIIQIIKYFLKCKQN